MTKTAPESQPLPPVAKKVPERIETHGDVRIDDYFWLRQKENPEVIEHLKAENAYTEAMLADVKGLREDLFKEFKARIKEDDSEVPYKSDGFYYYAKTLEGMQYPIYCRKRGSLAASEEVILDCNELAKGQPYFSLADIEVSPSHEWLAYAVDLDGSEKLVIFFKHLPTGKLSPESIHGTHASIQWAADNRTMFYTMLDERERPDRLYRHVVGTDPKTDVLVHKETDPQLFVYCGKSRSDRYIFLEISGKVTSEIHYLDASDPAGAFKVIEPRRRGVLYSVEHHENRFLIVTNDTVQNFRIVEAPLQDPSAKNWKEVRSGSDTLFIEDVDAFRSHLVVHEREGGLAHLRVIDLARGTDHRIEFPEPTYSIGGQSNAEYDTGIFRFSYNSLVTPSTVYDYDIAKRTLTTMKTQEIPSGYDRTKYRSERIFATSADGVQVPISLVYMLDDGANGADTFKRDGKRPLYLYGYGSYGFSMPANFGTTRLSLLNRGFVYAIAHIRGGSEMGRHWYESAKFLTKKNTFGDFISCAEKLIKDGYTSKGEIAIAGGSAGGMLMGAVINERPDLFKAAVAHVPFVDVVNTMLDETLPLTTLEYEEWGNPNDPEYYRYIKSYSPYDNVKKQAYPNLLVTAGLNDPRVTYWEPAKWVAKLREMKTDSHLLLQHINMEAGHGGPSGRFEILKEHALEYAFLLKVFGKA